MNRMIRFGRFSIGVQLVLILVSMLVGLAAANSVSFSGADVVSANIDPNSLAPPECAGINLTNLVVNHSSTYRWRGRTVYVYNGTNGNDLMIGTDQYDDFFGNGGDDCIIAGDGIDYLWSGSGNDVMNAGPDTDNCYSQGGNDTFISCQTQARSSAETDPENDPALTEQRPK